MGSAILFTAAHMQAIEDATVTSMSVNGAGHLIVTRHDGSTFDAGDVSVWLPGRITAINNLGVGNDPNSFVQNGWYAGTNWANSLLGYTFGIVEVLAYDANYIVQNFYLASNPTRWFQRSRVGGSWNSWVEKDVPATTTIRGEVILASDAEAFAGTDSNKVLTPHTLASVRDAGMFDSRYYTVPEIDAIEASVAVRLAKKESIPAFVVKLATAKNMSGTSTYSKIAFDLISLNRESCWDSGTFRFIAPVDGLYEFEVSITQNTNVGGPIAILAKNGVAYPSGDTLPGITTHIATDAVAIAYYNYVTATGRRFIELIASDYVEVFLNNANGTTIQIGNYGTAFSGKLVEAY